MVSLATQNSDGSNVDIALDAIATRGMGSPDGSSTGALYHFDLSNPGQPVESIDVEVGGANLAFDGTGRLASGLITSIQTEVTTVSQTPFSISNSVDQYRGLSLSVAQAVALDGVAGGAAPILLAGNDSIISNSPSVLGYAGDDTINITGRGTDPSVTGTTIDGGGGVNTALFASAFRSAATITGGGGAETVTQSNFDANLVSMQTLRFIDGSIYETAGSVGAQAALIFKGVLGRLPDGINAGGYALVAQQQGTTAAANQILVTTEAQADTGGLSNANYVTRLYQNILGRAPEQSALTALQGQLDTGTISRATVAVNMAASTEAQQVNAPILSSNSVFAADPGSVETLRAYEVLLNRLPEASSLAKDAATLDSGASLTQFYTGIMQSSEFLTHTAAAGGSDLAYLHYLYPPGSPYAPNQYDINASTPVANVIAFAHGDQITSLITPLVTATGGVSHQTG